MLHFAGSVPLYVEGAEIYIPADADMNAAYLERVLYCCAAAHGSRALQNDPLRTEGVQRVAVHPAGQSLRVDISGVDRSSGEEILQQAKALQSASHRVELHQVSSAASQKAAL